MQITSISQLKRDDILLHPDGHKRKVLAVLEECVLVTIHSAFANGGTIVNWDTTADGEFHIQQLIREGYTLEDKPVERWKPEHNKLYCFLASYGGMETTIWNGNTDDEFRYSVGNCFANYAEVEAYRDSLVEWAKQNLI